MTRDPWDGNIRQPLSYNKWLYVGSNPINRVDPLGLYSVSTSERTVYSEQCRCLIAFYEQDLFFGTSPSFIFYSDWTQWPLSLAPLPLPDGVDIIDSETWSRGISQNQNGEIWHVKICFGFIDYKPSIFPEKLYLVDPAYTSNLALWEQDLLVVLVYSFDLLQYKHYGGYVVSGPIWGEGNLPSDVGDNGEWPYSDLEILYAR